MAGSNDVKTWFKQEVYLWRLGGCVLWIVAIQIVSSLILSFLMHADLLHPLEWLKGGALVMFSLATLQYEFVLTFLVIGLTLMYACHYTVVPVVFVTRLEILWNVLSPSTLVSLVLYSAAGGLFARLFLAMGDGHYGGLTHTCVNDSSKQCLNECHLILVLHGTFIGILYSLSVFFGNQNCIVFPIIQQSKFFQIKVGLSPKLKHSFMFVIRRAKWFVLFYAVFGLSLQIWMTDLLHLSLSSVSVTSHLWNLLSLKLWWTAISTGTTMHFLFCAVAFLFTVFQTQRVVFPFDSPFEEEQYRSLKKVLSCTDLALLQHLGYLDLNLAVQHSKDRRQELFSISQPGGHPHNWNAVIKECLGQLKSVIANLAAIYEPPVVSKQSPVVQPSGYDPQLQSRSPMSPGYEMWRAENIYSGSPFPPRYQASVASAVEDASFQAQLKPISSIVKSYVEKKLNLLWLAFLDLSAIAYFVKAVPEARVRKAFAQCRLCIWAIEALSFLAAASFYEDKYGVCQKDLGMILGNILDLQQTINKVQKLETATSKRTGFANHDLALKRSLKCALKMALYRITTVFSTHLSAIDLSADHRKLLNRYLEFQE